MKRTKKYTGATEILTFPHSSQDELYTELNRLGWYWSSKKSQWERDDRQAIDNNLVKIRVWAKKEIVEELAQHFIESGVDRGLKFIEKSEKYVSKNKDDIQATQQLNKFKALVLNLFANGTYKPGKEKGSWPAIYSYRFHWQIG